MAEGARQLRVDPGSFPVGYLGPDEILYFQTRPAFWPFCGRHFLLGGVLSGGSAAGAWIFLSSPDFLSQVVGAWLVVLVVVGIAIAIVRWLLWRSISYAMTSSRVLTKTGNGPRFIVEIPHTSIQSVILVDDGRNHPTSIGNLTFLSAAPRGVVAWEAIAGPVQVRSLYEDVRSKRETSGGPPPRS